MRPSILSRIAVCVVLFGGSTFAQPATPPPAKAKFHLYLLMGQSNMAGRGEMTDEDRKPVGRVLVLDKERNWVPAAHPLHFDKPIAGVGLGLDFARTMLAHSGDEEVVIGLIPTAVGGTSLDEWAPGNQKTKLYANAMERAAKAMRDGTLKGVLWHQGEGDSKPELAESYGQRLAAFFAHLRRDLRNPDLPIVVGELGHFLMDKQPLAATVNEALNALPKHVPHTSCASAQGLGHKGDGTHFDAEALRKLGRRYAEAMIELQKQISTKR